MTVDEIFRDLTAHAIQGMMAHDQFANYYDFLGLNGYKRCHEYHFMRETCSYRKLCRYFVSHYNKLVPYKEVDDPEVIPNSWYNYKRQDVDATTKKNAVKSALSKWIEWEMSTKRLYESMYKELMELGEVASACFVKELIEDVSCELKKAEGYMLNKSTTGFDLSDIIADQKHKHHKYKAKMKKDFRGMVC